MPTSVVHCKRDKYDLYGGRPSIWGNPFSHLDNTLAAFKVVNRAEAIKRHRDWMFERILAKPQLLHLISKECKGKRIACWCVSYPATCSPEQYVCHLQTIVEIAEATDATH